jgi:DNA polymerase-1
MAKRKREPLELLVDAEIVAHQAADGATQEERVNEEEWTWTMRMPDAQEEVESRIDELTGLLRATAVRLCFGGASYWRRKLFPAYKAHRSPRKPLGYKALVEWMTETWPSESIPFLEADDVIGIRATQRTKTPRIMVSEDKDMLTVPGRLFNPRVPEAGVVEIAREEADRNHFLQTLSGDSSDNYPGCPGVGPVSAAKILDACESPRYWWEAVLDAFSEKGIGESEALVQAQLARICRAGDYNLRTGELTPWTPKGGG